MIAVEAGPGDDLALTDPEALPGTGRPARRRSRTGRPDDPQYPGPGPGRGPGGRPRRARAAGGHRSDQGPRRGGALARPAPRRRAASFGHPGTLP